MNCKINKKSTQTIKWFNYESLREIKEPCSIVLCARGTGKEKSIAQQMRRIIDEKTKKE